MLLHFVPVQCDYTAVSVPTVAGWPDTDVPATAWVCPRPRAVEQRRVSAAGQRTCLQLHQCRATTTAGHSTSGATDRCSSTGTSAATANGGIRTTGTIASAAAHPCSFVRSTTNATSCHVEFVSRFRASPLPAHEQPAGISVRSDSGEWPATSEYGVPSSKYGDSRGSFGVPG